MSEWNEEGRVVNDQEEQKKVEAQKLLDLSRALRVVGQRRTRS